MSIIDKLLQFTEDEAVTTAATRVSDSVALRETGKLGEEFAGEPMEVVVQITEVFDAGGTSVDFRFVSSNAANLGSPVTQHSTGAVVDPALGAKYRFPLSLPVADADATHIGIVSVSLGTYTTGKYSAWIQRAGEDQHTIND